MAQGRNVKTEGRRSSSYFSAPVVIFFVALGLVAVWMTMSSSTVPVQDFSHEEKPTEKQSLAEGDTRKAETNTHDSPEGVIQVNSDINTSQENNSDPQKNENLSGKSTENNGQENHEEKSKEGEDSRNGSNENVKEDAGIGKDGESQTGVGSDEESRSDSKETKVEGSTDASTQVDTNDMSNEKNQSDKVGDHEEKMGEIQSNSSSSNEMNEQPKVQASTEISPGGAQSEILNETSTENGAWSTQAIESKNENEGQQSSGIQNNGASTYSWKVCNVSAGPDYIPCLDNLEAIRKLRTTKHYEHRERHCPEEGPTCLVPLPEGYRQPIEWPQSREKIWYYNVPHTKLVEVKGHQNWVKVSGEYLIFPGGGTQFKRGAPHYIDFIEEIAPDIAWGKHIRMVLDVGCGVASFGGYLFDKDVLTMSLAPKDEHEAQVQFALERGIPAISAVMGTKRLPFPGRVFDVIHCARCRVPWHIEGGKLLLELNRLLRPGGYFVWSATPVYQKDEENAGIWKEMSTLLKNMCWEVVVINKDKVNRVGVAVFRKPSSNECYEKRQENSPPLCKESDDPNAAWYVLLQACMHKVPVDASEPGSQWPEQWPQRLDKPPYWLKSTQVGVYGKAAPEDFSADYEHWKHVIANSYLNGMGISWSSVRNVMDMRSVYGGFAAALKDLKVWVMNVVPIDSPDTLPIIYERGLFGIYHDWCESFNTYPRSYDLLHADHLFSKINKRCNLLSVLAEVDRILRPGGKLIIRDNSETIIEMENMVKSLHWEIRLSYSKEKEGLLCAVKTMWRPNEVETIISAIA
ncbi:S-adenosyl-l-methionine-dependent methyltransferases superfamily protein [Thalictrum thalictroides]|uniref:S-adenosyl-l-methionine-dependent methyltransferases superfamily protein n=1 Tax=Thalictrum thalictroides TaxID=46969 RepID=A0A7J6VFR7_THATH|nr:S-adenosyl-l-methionine-dependent methyltransferases superfamily protein [Thalictrum thalictroides]